MAAAAGPMVGNNGRSIIIKGSGKGWEDDIDDDHRPKTGWSAGLPHHDHRGHRRVYADEGENWTVVDPMARWTFDHLPPWARLQHKAEDWKHLPDRHNMDPTAQEALFLLGSRGHLGWAYANDLIAKLQNSGGYRNPGGWLHKAVTIARTEIRELDHQRKGRGRLGKDSKGFQAGPRYEPY